MEFELVIRADYKDYRVKVKRIYIDNRIEQFIVTAGNKSIVVESNRPLFRNKNLKYGRPNFSVIEGVITNMDAIEKLYDKLLEAADTTDLY